MNTPKLSLCMIAHNEAPVAPKLMQSCQGLYDELIVVDAGASPESLVVFADNGARIISHAWQNDAAAACNAALDAATGDWVLFLETDEAPGDEFTASVRHLTRQSDVGAACIPLHHGLKDGESITTHPLRLFRRTPNVRFVHPVCPDIVGAVLTQLASVNQRLAQVQGEVRRSAAVLPDAAAAQSQKSRTHSALRACVEAQPENLYAWYKLLDEARFWGDIDAWTDAAYEVDAWLSAQPHNEPFGAWYMGELLVLMAEGMFAGDDAQMVQFLTSWESRIAPSAAFHLRRGELLEAAGQNEGAQADYLRCIDLRQMTPNAQLATVRPLLGLSRLSMVRGDNATALELVDVALTEAPRDAEALLALTTLTHALGGAETTARVVEAYIESHGDTTELRAALGEAALRAGDSASAIRELEQATHMAPGGRAKELLDEAREAQANNSAGL